MDLADLSLESRKRIAMAKNAHIRARAHQEAAAGEYAAVRALVADLATHGVSVRILSRTLGVDRSLIARWAASV